MKKNSKSIHHWHTRFALNDANGKEIQLIAEKSGLNLVQEPSIDTSELYFDTFDWRLFNKGLLLVQTGARLELKEIETGEVIKSVEGFAPASRHWLAKDIPDGGGLHAFLRGTAEVRAFIEVCSLRRKLTPYTIRDVNDKIVLRASMHEARVAEHDAQPLLTLLSLHKVKGCDDEFEEVARGLANLGLAAARHESFFLNAALVRSGRLPDDYSPKLDVQLSASMPCRKAAIAILHDLTDIIVRNIGGIVDDIDTEFLHDFRVAIRRIRSALSQIRGALPENNVSHFRKEFARIAKLTNTLRDLDVQLLDKPVYTDMTPACLKHGLDEFFKLLAKNRREEHAKLSTALRTPAFGKLMAHWRKFLDDAEVSPSTENSETPTGAAAASFIAKRFKKAVKKGKSISDDSSDGELHALRIECKKLRYLLEFFSSCLCEKSLVPVIERLKALQDHLGELNDSCVLQSALLGHLKESDRGNSKAFMAAALGVLISKCNERKLELRGGLRKVFERFVEEAEADLADAISPPLRDGGKGNKQKRSL